MLWQDNWGRVGGVLWQDNWGRVGFGRILGGGLKRE